MAYRRAITVFLVALAVAIAPLAAAMAGPHLAAMRAPGHSVGHSAGKHVSEAAAPAGHATHADMTDCEKTKGTAGRSDCPCGEPGKSCPAEFCAAKCFKIFGVVPLPKSAVGHAFMHPRSAGPLQPPDWSRAPQPPPPRA